MLNNDFNKPKQPFYGSVIIDLYTFVTMICTNDFVILIPTILPFPNNDSVVGRTPLKLLVRGSLAQNHWQEETLLTTIFGPYQWFIIASTDLFPMWCNWVNWVYSSWVGHLGFIVQTVYTSYMIQVSYLGYGVSELCGLCVVSGSWGSYDIRYRWDMGYGITGLCGLYDISGY